MSNATATETRAAILAVLPATLGQIVFAVPANPQSSYDVSMGYPSNVVRELDAMVGNRVGAVTDGILKIAGYRAGAEVFAVK